jgi:hypothetical protein
VAGTLQGVYFLDNVSVTLKRYNFCGTKSFAFSGSYASCVTITGSNGNTLKLAASSTCAPDHFTVSLNVTMSQNVSSSLVVNFTGDITLVTPYSIPN